MSNQLDKSRFSGPLDSDSTNQSERSIKLSTKQHFDFSKLEVVESKKKLVVFSQNDRLHSLVTSLEIENAQIVLVNQESELIRLCSSGYVDLVVIDLKDSSSSRTLSLCYEVRKHSLRTIPFAFCGSGMNQMSLSQKIYAGSSVQFDWDDSSEFVKRQLCIALLQSETERLKVLVYRDENSQSPLQDFYSQLKGYSVTCGLLKDETALKAACEQFEPRMIFVDREDQGALCEIVEKFRKDIPNVPIVGISTNIDTVSRMRVLKSGVDEVLSKPVLLDDLMSCIKMQLRFSFLRNKYARNKLMGRFLSPSEFEIELDELLSSARTVDSKVAVCSIRIENYDEIVERRGMLTATLCNENLVELVKTRFRIQDLVARTENNEVLFAFPNEDKEMGNRLMIDLEVELSKYKLAGTSDTLNVAVGFSSIDSSDITKRAEDLIKESQNLLNSV